MHELTATQDALNSALEAAAKAGAHHIDAISLVIGTLSDITEDSVQFYFEMLSRGTVAEGAELRFRHEPALAACLECGSQFEVGDPHSDLLAVSCPACDAPQARLQIEGGNRFYVESIEVQDETNKKLLKEEITNERSKGKAGEA
jgi:hydrogenase nickel incorporation protein HypA/HybF